MIRRYSFLLLVLYGLIVCPVHVCAGPKDQLLKVESELSQQQQQKAELDRKEKETNENLESLRRDLIAVTESFQVKAEEQQVLQDKLDQLTQEIVTKKETLKEEKWQLSMLTQVLIELGRQPVESLFLQTGLTGNFIHRSILLRAILPRLKDQVDNIVSDLIAFGDLQAQLVKQEDLIVATRNNLENQQHDLDQLIKARQGLLQRTAAQKDAIAKQLVSLSSEAKDLRQLLDKVSPKHAPKSQSLRGIQTALKPPVAGTLTRRFGDKDNDGILSQGLTYTALPGSPVVAPCAGRVVFAGPFRGYGKILILQHDGGYHSFLAGFGRIDVDMGQDVEIGEPLGVLPVKGGERPELYFEWRHSNEPMDPATGIALSKNH
jgi:murein hydrolase activator